MRESEIRDEFLDFWISNNLNVLFIGHYGTGKTTRILEAFRRANLQFKYFSAATMDPWCDFVGIPKVVEESGKRYLDYILPKDFQDDSVEAIFMDEYNRSHKKVRNAVMELMQFKSINGRKFNKLRVVWAAINPEDEGEYQVEALDKAQKDRFQIQVQVPYEPSLDFYANKFNEQQAKVIISWWEDLSDEQKMEVSPRRMEYALQVYNMRGNLKHVLPHSSNPSKLNTMLNMGPTQDWLKSVFNKNDFNEAKKHLQIENNYATAVKYFTDIPNGVNANKWLSFFLPLISSEKLTSLMSNNHEIYLHIVKNIANVPFYKRIIQDVLDTNTNKSLLKKIKKDYATVTSVGVTIFKPDPAYFNKKTLRVPWNTFVKNLLLNPFDTTQQRVGTYQVVADSIPENLSISEAVETLEVLNVIAGRCHTDTIKTLPHFIGIVNHCINQIHANTGFDWQEIITKFGMKMQHIVSKINQLELEGKLLRPTKGGANAAAATKTMG